MSVKSRKASKTNCPSPLPRPQLWSRYQVIAKLSFNFNFNFKLEAEIALFSISPANEIVTPFDPLSIVIPYIFCIGMDKYNMVRFKPRQHF